MDAARRHKLRAAQQKAGISQREVAELAGISQESIRAYEAGRRRPTRERLTTMLQALQTPAYDANEILEAAGCSSTPTLFPADEYPNFYFTIDELQTEVESVAWPEFVSDNGNQVVAANAAVQALWGIDFAHERATKTRAELTLLGVRASTGSLIAS